MGKGAKVLKMQIWIIFPLCFSEAQLWCMLCVQRCQSGLFTWDFEWSWIWGAENRAVMQIEPLLCVP